MNLHSKVCPNFEKTIQCSLDGVAEAKGNSVSLDVYSSKFNKCRYVYPHRIVRPLKKGFVDNKEQLKKYLTDIQENSLYISAFIADNLKRANIRDCLNHSALFPCEYCFARETKVTLKKSISEKKDSGRDLLIEKINNIQKNIKDQNTSKVLKNIVTDLEDIKHKERQMTVWPSSTANQELRTKEKILDIVYLIQENQLNEESEPLTREDVKGVVGKSLLLDIESYDFVTMTIAEYMHLVCLGVVKRLTELTFNVGLNRTRITKRKLSSTKEFNSLMAATKMVFEFSRRSRDLDFAVYKAEEFRNLLLFFFPHVLQCLEKSAKERSVWLYLVFMVRACVLPDNEYFNVSANEISIACKKFYHLYERLFGALNCSYNTHVLPSHLPQIRALGPLTETSAFKFESFYGEI